MTGLVLKLVFESHLKNIAEVESYVTQIVREYNIGKELFGNILITLTEAVSNAIIHGNHAKKNKKVYIFTQLSQAKICFCVKDEGNGFDPNTLPDPTAPENLMALGGRGVFLMRQLSDNMSFDDCGRSVKLEFNLN